MEIPSNLYARDCNQRAHLAKITQQESGGWDQNPALTSARLLSVTTLFTKQTNNSDQKIGRSEGHFFTQIPKYSKKPPATGWRSPRNDIPQTWAEIFLELHRRLRTNPLRIPSPVNTPALAMYRPHSSRLRKYLRQCQTFSKILDITQAKD